MTHTPLPWEVDYSNADVSQAGIKTEDGINVAWMSKYQPNCSSHENAEFIVKAVNCHDELVEALKECSDDLEALVNHEYIGVRDYPSMDKKYQRDMQPVEKAKAALAKAGVE